DSPKAKYGGMNTSELKRMRELEEENAKLKKMFADVSLQNHAMKELFAKKGWWQQRKEPARSLWLSAALISPALASWRISVDPPTTAQSATGANKMLLS